MTALFTQVLAQTDADIKSREAGIAERALRRKLQTAYDSAWIQRAEAQQEIDLTYDGIGERPQQGVAHFNVNTLVARRATIQACDDSCAIIAEEYRLLFAEELPNLEASVTATE